MQLDAIGKRLFFLRKKTGMIPTDAAKYLNIKLQSYLDYESGKTKQPSVENLVKLAELYNSDFLFIQFGQDADKVIKGYNHHVLPLLTEKEASHVCVNCDFSFKEAKEWIDFYGNISCKGYALIVKSDSMVNPSIKSYSPGTIIFIDPEKEFKNNSLVVASHINGELTFKKYIVEAGKKYLHALNPKYDPIPINEEWKICGPVIEGKVITEENL